MNRITILVSFFVFFSSVSGLYAQKQDKVRSEEEVMEEALSQEAGVVPNYRQELRKPIVVKEEYQPQELDAYLRYMGPQGSGAQSGKIGIIDSAAEYSYEIKAGGKLPVQFGVIARNIGIENSTAVELPAHLTATSFGVETTLPFFNVNKTYITLAIAPSFFSDNWYLRNSAFSFIQRAFLIYQPNEQWVFVCGANYTPRYNDPVAPIVGFIYKPNDRLTFSIIPDSPEIAYLVNDKLTVFLQGELTDNEYRVTKDGVKNTVINYRETHVGAGLRYKWNKHVTGSFSAGGVLDRTIKYRPDSLGKVSVQDGFYTEFRFVLAM